MNKPVTWVSAPAGSGKSTLVAGHLDSRELPCIWYQCDEGDSDLATFFYYMGLAARKAAPRQRKPLPLLTPEYLTGIPTFTRKFFEQLYGRLAAAAAPTPLTKEGRGEFLIVLDNYQDVPADSPFHDMMAIGLGVIPAGVHVTVISRDEPPPALARLRANGAIALIEHRPILFTLDETRELAHERFPGLGNDVITAMHEKTDGWAAGLILMLERGGFDPTGAVAAGFNHELIFDYFAGELFGRVDEDVRDFLLKTAILPDLSVPLAEKLTGDVNSGHILETLNRRHLFTEVLGLGREYRFHPLFREFLLDRARTAFLPRELADIRKAAALLLEQAGRTEDAARLYRDAGDRDGLCRMVVQHARELLMQGRNRTVEEWIAGIPGAPGEDDPWLLYWTGMCSFPVDMPRARTHLGKALASFTSGEDTAGIYLAWAGIVDTYAFGLDEWKRLDGCIAVFDGLRKAYPDFPSREIELIVSSRMLISLTLRKTDRPQRVHGWLQRVSALLRENPSFDIQMDTLFCMSVYYLWKGEYDKNAVLLAKAETEIRQRKPPPFTHIRFKLMSGIHRWITAEYESARNTLSEGLDISAESGVHVFDSLLWGFRAAAEMAPGRLEQARASLENQMASLLDATRTLDIFFYHVNSAWHALLTTNPSLAAEHLDTVAPLVEKMGTPYYRSLWSIGMAQAAFLLGRAKDAASHIRTALRTSRSMKSQVMEWYSLLIDSWLHLRDGREAEGLRSLRLGLSLGRRHGYVHLEFHQPGVMGFLCAKALEEEIEPDYVKGLIGKLGLTPPGPRDSEWPTRYLHGWPYPIRVYTLGRFEILRDDRPIGCAGKEQKKPLELLKALIAFGGRDVPAERLTDALWPDSDGDQAAKSFETTLARLRRLLGRDDYIRQRARQLSLNPLCCWADALALEQFIHAAREAADDRLDLLYTKAVNLHRGPFLPADSGRNWVLTYRETLKNRLLRVIGRAGRHYEQSGEWERAAEYYAKGIETDSLAEEFYRRLMVCHLKLGNNSEAVTTYNRCRNLLRAELGIKPSSETEAVYSSVLQNQ